MSLMHSSSIRIALMISALSVSAVAGADQRRPNVIIIMPDQMRGQAMGIAGDPQVQTPNIDQLARDGLYLPNTFANSPVCSPARATILTGMYPHRHGMMVNDLRLREERTTLAELLAGAGYATGFVGKWHLDGGVRMPGFVPPGPRRQGFQFWAANECNHNHFDSIYFHDADEPIPIKRFEVEAWMDEAIRFIRANQDRPFFLWWACGPPHNPYAAPERFERLYDPATLTLRPNWQAGVRFGSREDLARYYAAITAIDEQAGRLMKVLDELHLTDDTIVLFTSDHGDMLGSQGCAFKCKPWDESIRVPGIIRYPRRIKGGQRRDTLFSHVDFLPTLLSWCGIAVPEYAQGIDLSRRFAGPAADTHPALGDPDGETEPEAIYLQIHEPRQDDNVPAGWRGVRTQRYVYARTKDKAWVLHDLKNDPYELKNLVDDPAYADLRGKLDGLVSSHMARTGDHWEVDLTEHRVFDRGPAVYDPDELSQTPTR